jgi:antitoxin ParD1/3/4
MNVSLSPELERFINKTVEGGYYSSASEVIRAGLRLLKEEEDARHIAHIERLRNLIKKP